ncbi:MAG: hypothetical protein ABGX07_13965 [Pirellulaceae bacterium]
MMDGKLGLLLFVLLLALPTVYLIDKDGYVRSWRMGELNWKGAGAQNMIRDRIKKMLAE